MDPPPPRPKRLHYYFGEPSAFIKGFHFWDPLRGLGKSFAQQLASSVGSFAHGMQLLLEV